MHPPYFEAFSDKWAVVQDRKLLVCAFAAIFLFYAKLRFDVATSVSWLFVFSIPWMCGIYILFKAAIPSMLASTERALSAQHSSDCNATAMARQPLRIRVGSREWDEFAPDGPAGEAAGYWAGPTCSRAAPRPSRVSPAFPAQGPCRARWWHFRWRCCWATS